MKVLIKSEKGITLVALVITIIVLIILATISINLILKEDGILDIAYGGNEQYRSSRAREKLVMELGNAQIEKEFNTKYNENEFLDNFIVEKVKGTEIKGDTVIVDGYAFTLDRTVPKIGEYIGKIEDLRFPGTNIEVTYARDYKIATITINAKEETYGIEKIQILQDGYLIEEYLYKNEKGQITETHTTNHMGEYEIKVYGKLMTRDRANVEGLIQGIVYTPNGNSEYKKSHTVEINAAEDVEKVKSIKYQWLATTVEPAASTFTKEISNGGTITENTLSGKYYLWTLLETETGKQIIEKSEVFYFDNQGPTVSSLTSTAVSATSFTLKATASDAHVGKMSTYKFYVGGTLKGTVTTTATTASYTVTGVSTTTGISCYVIVSDSLGNTSAQKTVTAKTKIYTWSRWSATSTTSSYSIRKLYICKKLFNGQMHMYNVCTEK